MLKSIPEFGKYVAIAGFRNAQITDTERLLKETNGKKGLEIEVQLFDASLVTTWEHLYFAALDSLTAFRNRENISRSLAMETMLYASAQRQIRKATELAGIKPATTEMALLIIGDSKKKVERTLAAIERSIKAQRDDSVLEISDGKIRKIKKAFGITGLEIEAAKSRNREIAEALVSLVVERSALLATQH